jgi:hypothetical protein
VQLIVGNKRHGSLALRRRAQRQLNRARGVHAGMQYKSVTLGHFKCARLHKNSKQHVERRSARREDISDGPLTFKNTLKNGFKCGAKDKALGARNRRRPHFVLIASKYTHIADRTDCA